jgi:hypothetical protein
MAGINPIDFPANPASGQTYTAPTGVDYIFDGYGWTVTNFAAPTYELGTVADILWQVRVLLQDTDLSSGAYRYADGEIVTNINQGMGDLFRIRPDLFLEQGFVVPIFNALSLNQLIGLETQYISPLIFYVVGLTQARDDEQTQDVRAGVFFKTFQQQVVTGVLE